MTQRIIIHAQEIKKEKTSFIACSANLYDNVWVKVKFTKACENAPKTSGLYELKIDFDKCSLERGKPYTNAKGEEKMGNDTIWVREIEYIRKQTEEELKAKNREELTALFGGAKNDAGELPF